MIWFFLFSTMIFAQQQELPEEIDIITLFNGRMLEGKLLVEDHEKDEYKFQISENHTLLLKGSEIKEIQKSVKAGKVRKSTTFSYPTKKFFSQIQIGLLTGKEPTYRWEESENTQSISIDLTYDYALVSWLNVGLGTGLNLLDEGYTLPVYLHLRGDVIPKQVTPFYELKAGYHFPLYKEVDTLWPEELIDATIEGSFLFAAAVGIQFYTSSPYSFLISMGYQQQGVTHTYNDPFWEESTYSDHFIYQRLSIQAGIRF
ncbi:MAG: hypothetical protein AAF655_04640 [Bacteroidota bacterium]